MFGQRPKKKIHWFRTHPVPIVADAAISTGGIGHGRLIPLLILDTSHRADLEEFIRVHQYSGPGDVLSQWATLEDGSGRVGLNLSFKKPMDIDAFLAFQMPKYGGLLDQILTTKGLYLQAGRPGDRFIKNPDAPKVIVEIADTGFGRVWDEIFLKSVVNEMRRRGLKRRDAKEAAKLYIKNWRDFGSFRMR